MIAFIPQKILGLASGLLRSIGSWKLARASTAAASAGMTPMQAMAQGGPISRQMMRGYAMQSQASVLDAGTGGVNRALDNMRSSLEETYGAVQKVNTGLDRFGGLVASSNIQLEQARYQRGMQFSQATGRSYQEYVESTIEKEKAGAQLSADIQNLTNTIMTGINRAMTSLYNIYNAIMGSKEQKDELMPWRKFVNDVARMPLGK